MRIRDNVRIVSGAFNGCSGYVLRVDDSIHVRLVNKEEGGRFPFMARQVFKERELETTGDYAVEI